MFAVGHLALGYLAGKVSSHALKSKINIPWLFVFSVLPDIDLVVPFMIHRGATHSIIVLALSSTLLSVIYKKKIIPYLVATATHSLIGDFFAGGSQLFWPVSREWVGFDISLSSLSNILSEWLLFAASLILMFKTKDLFLLLKPNQHNFLLLLPAATTTLPIVGVGMSVPAELIIPHASYSILFILSILSHVIRA